MEPQELRQIIWIMVFLSLLGGSGLWIGGAGRQGLSFLFGGLLMSLNLLVLTWSWGSIFLKKSIALSSTAIVFKYTILGILIYWASRRGWIEVVGFAAGLSLILPAVVAHLGIQKIKGH
jgi:hypothetical protein